MTENKRFVSITDIDLEISIKDNLKKKYPFSLVCENLDEFEPLLNKVINVCGEMNKLWEQTQRFEDHNKRLMEENEQLRKDATTLIYANQDYRHENEQLKQELFEARKDYLIETADISDKLYLDEIIEKERKEIFE